MQSELKVIKKKYGENFAKLCRSLFPTILEEDGKLLEILDKTFEPSHFLYEDLVKEDCVDKFKDYIYSFFKKEENEIVEINETPEELFEKAGYKLYKCETNKDVLSFKKYYKAGEQLCTFNDPNRIKNYIIFWAVKKNVDEIKRKNFTNPKRQDEYGTSVLSLQFYKGEGNTLSIKNRYNHTVDNPDATFSNDLENIYPGLTESFKKHYNVVVIKTKKSFAMEGYVMANYGRFYKYNYEVNNVYYCPNNIVIKDFIAKKYDKNRYEVIDYFVLDKQEKTMFAVGDICDDYFVEINKDLKNIAVTKQENGNRKFEITNSKDEKSEIIVDKFNNIIEYTNNNLKKIGFNFLYNNASITKLNIPNVEIIGNNFMYRNKNLSQLNIENLKTVGSYFLYSNKELTEFNAPSLMRLGENGFYENEKLEKLNIPELESIHGKCLVCNNCLKVLDAPNLKYIGSYFMSDNKSLEHINAPKLERIDNCFLRDNESLKEINFPNVKTIGNMFLYRNLCMEEINLPNIEEIGSESFSCARNVKRIDMPKLKIMGMMVLKYCDRLDYFNAPNLEVMSDNCFKYTEIEKLELKSLEVMGDSCFGYTDSIKELIIPNCETIGKDCFLRAIRLNKIDAERLYYIGTDSFKKSIDLKEINLPALKTAPFRFKQKIKQLNKNVNKNEKCERLQ